MRNASDIFCLKELKDGDTSGTQMFSVNGQCHLTKLSRRRNLHAGSSSFEYGSGIMQQPSLDAGEGKYENDSDLGDIKEDIEELHLGEGEPDNCQIDVPADSAEDQIIHEEKTTSTNHSPNKKKKSPVFRKLNTPKEEEKVSESAMARNPLTGAGIETETHKKSKKGPLRRPKLMW